ncbi:MAG TPA: tryptophan--tRNA ligase [Candidatus Saccharimonadales bacterium]|jgi:tryptophanyl-tRNA synthetase|nr:tryptophan--tRNA ligase [Candidatus Saccharimonadales bacterium]
MSKPVILTGLRANNDLTLGNYFGGILPIIDMAKSRSDEYQINMFIPDLHSFTTPIDHSTLQDQIMHNARLFTAAGLPLDNESIYLYRQSYISAHSELTWILDCFTGMGEMSRMTQFKDKSGSIGTDRTTIGLFNYPVLMAADILLYNAKYIPVGEDQTQHLEFTRDIAERINSKFADVFMVPDAVSKQHEFFGKDQGLRIKDLADPTKKMSKSDESGKGVIFLGDDPAVAAKKVMSATTDDKAEIHFDKANQPGISNLLEILSLLRGQPLTETVAEFEGQTRYGDFKQVVASEVEQFLTNFQQKLATVDDAAIIAKLEQSERDLSQTANATLLRAQQAVGLRPRS